MTTSFDLTDPTKPTIDKSLSATLDYIWDWSTWLPAGDSIDSYVITKHSSLTVASASKTANAVTVNLSGGKLDRIVWITCKITTAQGRTDERTIYLRITKR